MEIMKFKPDEVIAEKNDKVVYWYLIQEGTVIQKLGSSSIKLEKNAIIGILEKDMFLCDYIAGEDTVLAAFVCRNDTDLKNLLTRQEKIRNVFLRTAIWQRHQMLKLYSDLDNKTRQFHMFVESLYNDYKTLCAKFKIEMNPFPRITLFNSLEMRHKAEVWEINNSTSIATKYMQDYLQLMGKDDSMTVGVIMETAAQMRRFALGIGEMDTYLSYNKDILISDTRNDLFALFFDLSIKTHAKKYDIEPITKDLDLIANVAVKLGIYNNNILTRRINEAKNYNYAATQSDSEAISDNTRKEIDIMTEDCLAHILSYAGLNDVDMDKTIELIESYLKLPDKYSTDKEVHALRRNLTTTFYDIYHKVFMRGVKDEASLTPVLQMFLNFGFMDVAFVGEENALKLYELSAHLDICHSTHIYTIYEWLKCIYKGEKNTSKNEFDMDYISDITEMLKRHKITKEEFEEYKDDRERMVDFEIKNMFSSVGKQTYGRVTTFCPILCENDLMNAVDKMLVTADKLEESLNAIRKVDYSVFYREVMFSDPDKGIQCEKIMKEVLPDIILMPNTGIRSTMWQETSGIKSDTPGRFMFPIFTMADVNDLMLQVMGAFRWEMCRKLQGVHWNDIRDKSLTAEYCSYIQFYRKNNELSSDAKEKIKSALAKAKNNYKEVFIGDYINWINYESKGSFRLNKISRDILVRYCPFEKAVRNELKENPIYQASISKFEIQTAKTLRRYQAVYDKYVKAGGESTQDLKDNILFYQM
ncbi:MAG: cyclic nucleotide-binding domain-containing protein [Lachnospiraceae bacterium]|nr:cyclic nucleotide-binding domain-containing protein [Lachnospiraceae bacterium]